MSSELLDTFHRLVWRLVEGPYRAEERIERPIGLVWSGYIPSATHAQRALQTSMGLSQYTRRKGPNSSEDICLFLLDILTLWSSAYCRRRMEREAKAKVVTSVWGADFIQFLGVLAILPRSIWKNRMNSTFSSKLTEAKQLAWQGIE